MYYKLTSYPQIQDYVNSLVPKRNDVLIEMEKYAEENYFPIIGPSVGNLCYELGLMIKAKKVFELGSGYGYSTAFFAQALKEVGGGKIWHVVWHEHLSLKAKEYMKALGYDDMIEYRVSEAVQTLEETDETFDIIFNDIEKASYPASLPVIEKKLRPGGILITDNTLWKGRVMDKDDFEKETIAVREYSKMLFESDKWVSSIIPLRDGVSVSYKK